MRRPEISFLLLAAAIFLAGCAPLPRTNSNPPPDVDLRPGTSTNAPARPAAKPVPPPAPAPVVAPPAAPVATLPPGEWIEIGPWARSHSAWMFAQLTAGSPQYPPTFALRTPRGAWVFQAENQLASWEGTEIRLGFKPRIEGGQLRLHTLDVQKNLLPLLAEPPGLNRPGRVVVLDPGHGGTDSGTHSAAPVRHEKTYTLDWALRARPLLEAQGWRVVLTRTNDAEVSLAARVALAEAARADVFLSLHFNATGSPIHAGVETYCLTPPGMPSNLTRGYEDNAGQTFPNNAFDAQNLQLATRLHRELIAATGVLDRGVRRARFLTVLRGQNRPAVLVEGGYLTSPREATLIDSPEYRQKLAEAVARALP